MDIIKKNYYIILVAITCSLAFTSLGGALSWASPSLFKLKQPDSPISLTSSEESWIGSFVAIGAMCIAIPYTYLFNTSGRKWLISSIAAFYICGWTALVFASEVAHIYIGRFLLGCAAGPTYGVIPVYLAEVVNKNVRGVNIALLVISQSIGSLIQYGLGPILTFQTHNIISVFFPVLLFICSLFIPETPYYLLSINKEEECQSILMKLRGTNTLEDVREEFESIKKCLEESPPMSYKHLLSELRLKKTQKVLVIVLVATFIQQYCGVGAIIVYMETIFTEMCSSIPPKDAVIMTEILADVTVFITLLFIDKIGRKSLLLTAASICIIAHVIVGFYFLLLDDGYVINRYTWIGMVSIFFIHIGFAMGLGPVPMLVMSEIMSFSAKGWLSGFYSIVQGTFNASSIKLFQIVRDAMGHAYPYWIFAISIAIAVGFLTFYMPETKGKTLQEIQHLLSTPESNRHNSRNSDNVELGNITNSTNS